MKCPFCGYEESKVVDSRPTEEGQVIRRRRECLDCTKRFTTYEKIEDIHLIIVKKDQTRESFNRNKVMNGIIRACEKRPVTMEQIEEVVDRIEHNLYNNLEKEVPSDQVGVLVMDELKHLDEVAYVRFASVYRSFKDIETFVDELTKMLNEKKS